MPLAFHEAGPPGAPTIVFLHGLIASRWTWQATTAHFDDYHCLVPDLPGHGESRGVAWRSIADTARQVVELIRARAAGGRAHLVGLSLGGMVALTALALAPDVVGRVVISGVNVKPLPLPLRLNSLLLLPSLRGEHFLNLMAANLHVSAGDLPAFRQDLQQIARLTVLRGSLAAAGFQLPPGLASVASPVLALAGQNENALVLESLRTIAATLPQSQARLVPASRHGWISEQPDLWQRTLRAWLCQAPLPQELIQVSLNG
jgi:pimeloyl-ACP methyl ester carboxylesterase